MDPEIKAAFTNLAKLVEDTSSSLQAEMAEINTNMERGFDRIDAATRRNTTSLSGGAYAIAALNRWAQQRDKLDSKRDREIRDRRVRFQKVEQTLKRRERRAS
jgi:hypothetical protein